MIKKNKETLKIVIKNYPLSSHNLARKSASAALAADTMGKFWEVHEILYKNIKQMGGRLALDIASDLGLDPNEFEKKMNSSEIQNRVNRDIEDARKAGVNGTPTLFINGRLIRDRSIIGIQNVIDSLLEGKQ
ncbi:MAG: thioredoxin domain-containing protein [Deltaproteobacteria bacterium]|nr:thioredoxin domain-containing protein [Deltaproteobacteria bacterium]